jgi:subtilisin-like proprotein convertase family protein
MKNPRNAETRRSLLLILIVLGIAAAVIVLPFQFRSEAGAKEKNQNSDSEKNFNRSNGLENYDIRTDKTKAETIIGFRQDLGRDAVAIADARDRFVTGEQLLREKVPTLKIEYNDDIRTPEVIAPDVNQGRAFLTAPTTPAGTRHADVLLDFLKQNNELVGASHEQINDLKVFADYTNPNGILSFVELEQEINGIPVFRGTVKAGFTKSGEMIRVINNFAPNLDYRSLPTDFGDPLDAVKAAAQNINFELKDSTFNEASSSNIKAVFGKGDWATTAEKMYFPTEPGVARTAWRVLIWEPVNAYYVIVDAETGEILWRKNIANDQTQAATYNVYTNPNSMLNVAESPAPFTPGPLNPTLGTQGTQITRSNVTLIGNEGANSFNNLGWITDNTNGVNGWTDGNAVEAGVNLVTPDNVDAPTNGVNRVFNFNYNPAPGIGGPPDALTTPESRGGAVTQLFYINNRYHDELYKLGFTEAARNFQNDNFGRGGAAADRVLAQAQDFAGTNNANFLTPADGTRGRMRMYVFTQAPGRDGSLDADVVVHEHTHGLSNRLIGNASGLTGNRGGSMGEGWSDFYGLALLSQASDPINGIYTTGAYVTSNIFGIGTTNSYYGIRRFPYAVRAFTGGAGNLPYNPLTFADLNTGCVLTDGAFPPSPPFAGNACNEVHNGGEVWATALWEVRAKFVQRLGFASGNTKILQLVTDGMKMTQNNPNFLQARDAIIAAAQASAVAPEAGVDVVDVREGFRIRGMGFSATDNGTTAVEAFDQPNVVLTNPFSVSDTTGDNDGFPEPGESVLLNVAVTNTTGAAINNVTASVTGGGSANYGSIANAAVVTRQISYTVPAASLCGSFQNVTINVTSDVGAQTPQTRSFRLGKPASGAPATFANAAPITIVDNAAASLYPSNVTVSGLTGNKNIKLNLNGLTHTFPADIDILLVGPGGQKFVPMSDSGGGGDVTNINLTLTDSAAGAMSTTQLVSGEFKPGNTDTTTDAFPAPAPAAPYDNPAPAGSATFASSFGTNGATMNGTWALYVRDDAGTDTGQIANGWSLTFESDDYVCSIAPKTKFDFDGDGKADVSVFRPSNGVWYLLNSGSGFTGAQFGASGDKIVPADYDGDGKTDLAVFRNGTWYLQRSTAGFTGVAFGVGTDIPQPADFDNDGKAELAVWRPSNATWYVFNLATNSSTAAQFGDPNDKPVVGDYDADGKADFAVFRPSNGTWYLQRSTAGFTGLQFGDANDKAVPADYDGDGKTDVAVFRPSNGVWYSQRSTAGFIGTQFGASGDVPTAADYDGDGKADLAVFRAGTWYLQRSTAGFTGVSFGIATDSAAPAAFVP